LALASVRNLPPSIVAMTVVALGASLPVLAITAIAALRGYTQIAIGHLMTASVFNLLGVLGIAALVHPLTISPVFSQLHVYAVLGSVVLLLPLLSASWRLSRPKGALLMLAYVGYLGFIAWHLGLIPHLAA
jgi:cation:H+ antiporter